MLNRILTALALVFLYCTAEASNPASQQWVINYLASYYTPIPTTYNWPSLCPSGQSLSSASGCTPDCTDPTLQCPTTSPRRVSSQQTNIPEPYLSNGVVVFQLNQTGLSPSAQLRVITNNLPAGVGYMCQVLNSDATPATLFAIEPAVGPTPTMIVPVSVINMSGDINTGSTNTSSASATTVQQPTSSQTLAWDTNPLNQLYLYCLGYQRVGSTSTLRSYPACGGTGTNCVRYTLG